MVARTAIVPSGDPSLLSYALTPEAHDLRDHTGVPGVGGGGGGETLAQTLVIGNVTGPNDISVDTGQQVGGLGNLALGGYGRIGTLTDPVATGDFGAGLAAGNRQYFDASAGVLALLDGAGVLRSSWDTAGQFTYRNGAGQSILNLSTPGFLRLGTAGEGASLGDVAAGLAGGGRWHYNQALNRFQLYESGGGTLQTTLALDTALTTVSQDIIGAINEAFAAAGGTPSFSFLNVGTTTDAVAPGDLASGLLGAGRMFYDQSGGTLNLWDAAGVLGVGMGAEGALGNTLGLNDNAAVNRIALLVTAAGVPSIKVFDGGGSTVWHTGEAGFERVGSLTDPVALGDFGAGAAGAARWWYDQSSALHSFYDGGGALKYTLDNGVALATTAQEIIGAINEVNAASASPLVLDRSAAGAGGLDVGVAFYSVSIPANALTTDGMSCEIEIDFEGQQTVGATHWIELGAGIATSYGAICRITVDGVRSVIRAKVYCRVTRRSATEGYVSLVIHYDQNGDGQSNQATHSTSIDCGVMTIPSGTWAGVQTFRVFGTSESPGANWSWLRATQLAQIIQ